MGLFSGPLQLLTFPQSKGFPCSERTPASGAHALTQARQLALHLLCYVVDCWLVPKQTHTHDTGAFAGWR